MKRLALLALAILLPALARAQAQADVPVTQVVLYTSGVGYFQHSGTVRGEGAMTLRFREEQISDVLKSLVVQDLGGGGAEAVVYPSQAPISRTLGSFQVDLSGQPSLSGILGQLRGARVTLRTAGASIEGTILSVERRAGENQSEVPVVTILSGASMRPVPLSEVSGIEIEDARLRDEFEKALLALAEARDQERKPVEVRFSGSGARRVRVGYVVEAPVWKTTYRLVLGEVGATKAFLQGWAIVENQTERDWEDVRLSLIAGRPVSFRQDLYTPLYVPRPVVQNEALGAVVRPPSYEEGMDMKAGAGELRGTIRDANTGEPLPGANVRVEGTRIGASTDVRGQFTLRGVPDGAFTVQASFIGYASQTRRARSGGRVDFALGMGDVELQEVVVTAQAGRISADAAPAPQMESESYARLDASGSVTLAAEAGDAGDYFEYVIAGVDLPRQRSALLPIAAQDIQAERVSLYNRQVRAEHPMRGVRFTNATGLHLAAGPITVYADGAYAGDARLPDLPPGDDRFLAYAVDLDVDVQIEPGEQEQTITAVKIVDGVLTYDRRTIRSETYTVKNESGEAREVLIEHPRRGGFDLVETIAPEEETESLRRFRVTVAAGDTETLTIREESKQEQRYALINGGGLPGFSAQTQGEFSPELQNALRRISALQSMVREREQELRQTQNEIRQIEQEQNRLRENLRSVDNGSEYGRRLLDKLNDQETQIERLNARRAEQERAVEVAREALRDYVRNLDAR